MRKLKGGWRTIGALDAAVEFLRNEECHPDTEDLSQWMMAHNEAAQLIQSLADKLNKTIKINIDKSL